MLNIDPQFRQMRQGARRRRRRSGLLRGVAVAAVLLAAAGIGWQRAGPALLQRLAGDDTDQMLVQVEDGIQIAPVVRADTFTNIPGDPMIIPSADSGEPAGTRLEGPGGLVVARVGAPAPDRLTMVSEQLYVRERRLVAALPTTREEFALFQAERSRERLMNASAGGQALPGLPQSPEAAMTSGVTFIREAAIRPALWQDLILQIRLPTETARLLQDNGFDRATAERTAARLAEELSQTGELPRGALLAVRYRMQAGARQVLQLSLYRNGAYLGSLAMSGSGQLVAAADPWADQPLLDQSAEETASDEDPQFRLLDVIYSAAIRQGVPGDVVGEAIALMSKVYDLDAFAADGDRLRLVYANRPGPGSAGAGQILFVGVSGPSGDKPCYVVPDPEGGFDCHAPGARVIAVNGQPAMTAPVAGVLVRRFAPVSGNGAGGDADSGTVAWQAAQGSPVAAIAAGRVTAVEAGPAGSTVTIAHDGGLASVYRGLDGLPAGIAPGAAIRRGAVIGRVAARGAGDQAGLVLRLLKDGTAVDPVPYLAGGNEVLASDAVETLISRIIHVESGGNAAAKNPLSTATGLGQFIESTWLRMMTSYRPDLVATMDRRQLLDLRLQPDLSRQMVRHLAQENEAFLRARGHTATPGNLYLAHFLGPMGAAQALSADPARPVGEVMGAGVVSANPFLRSYTIADLRTWADRKMNARAVATAVAVASPVRTSPEVERFVALMDAVLTDPRSAAPGGSG